MLVAGVSHGRTPARARERLHLDAGDAADLGRSLAREGREAVVLTTCSRTELYLTGPSAEQRARRTIADLSGHPRELPGIYVHTDERAAEHLFRVAAGLE